MSKTNHLDEANASIARLKQLRSLIFKAEDCSLNQVIGIVAEVDLLMGRGYDTGRATKEVDLLEEGVSMDSAAERQLTPVGAIPTKGMRSSPHNSGT